MQDPSRSAADGSASRVSVIEIVGFAGITAGLYGTFLVLAEEAASETIVGLVSLILAVVFLVAGALVGGEGPDRVGRFRSVCWYLSVSTFSSMLSSWIVEPTSLLAGWGDLFPVFLLTAIYAFALWVFLPRLLQQLIFFQNAIAAVAVFVLPAPSSIAFGEPDLTGLALVLWIGGAAWFALGYAGRLRPPRTGMVLGLLTSIPAPLLFAVDSPEAAFLLVLATSVVYLVFGGRIADRAVSGIAVVGVVVGVVGALAAVGIDDTPSGTAVLVLGAVLLAGAVVAARQVDGRGRPAFGRPVLPLGPRWGMTVIAPETATATPPAVPPPPPDEARGTD